MISQDAPIGGAENTLAETAYEAIRAINHLTTTGAAIPAPEMYSILGNLTCLGHGLDQALRQLARGLATSLSTFAVYEDDGGNPDESVAYAIDSMQVAAAHAAQLGTLLQGAQDDISRQGVYPPRRQS